MKQFTQSLHTSFNMKISCVSEEVSLCIMFGICRLCELLEILDQNFSHRHNSHSPTNAYQALFVYNFYLCEENMPLRSHNHAKD